MKKYRDLLEEKAPESVLKKREGVSYPSFRKYSYFSRTAGRDTPVNVLLPQGYSEDKRYPVLYLMHGYWSDENWMSDERVHISEMLTNLIADGKAAEMIIVCPYIYCSKDRPRCTAMDYENSAAYDNFINDLRTDLMPFIESSFSVLTERESTAITGFSMGGREALFIGFSMPERFGYIGAVCPAPGLVRGTESPFNLEFADLIFVHDAPKVLLLSAAADDNVVRGCPELYHRLFTENGTEHIWHHINGTGHDADSVIPHLYNFFRMIFIDTKT